MQTGKKNSWDIPPELELPANEVDKIDDLVQGEALGFNTPINIVLAGATGDGKSTLANAMLGVELAETGSGFPVTKGIRRYQYKDKPITLFDTEGYEVLDAAQTVGAIEELVTSTRMQIDCKHHIHIVWLCISAPSRRLQQVHIDLVNLCSQLEIPIIVVVTKSFLKDETSDKFLQVLGDSLPNAASIIPVLAKETHLGGICIAPFGLTTLLDATLKVTPKACHAALKFAQIADFDRKIESANQVVNTTAAAAIALSLPAAFIPGGHAALLIPLEVRMLYRINKTLGISFDESQRIAVSKGTMGIVMATLGGKLIFIETIKVIPFIGQISSMVVGGAIAGTIVKLFGTAYVSAISDTARSGTIPSTHSIIDAITDTLLTHKQGLIAGTMKFMSDVTRTR